MGTGRCAMSASRLMNVPGREEHHVVLRVQIELGGAEG